MCHTTFSSPEHLWFQRLMRLDFSSEKIAHFRFVMLKMSAFIQVNMQVSPCTSLLA